MKNRSDSGIWGDVRIDPGELTEPLYVMKYEPKSLGSGGEYKGIWTAESDVTWAKVETGSGREVIISESETAIARFKFTIYYRADLTAQDRIKYDGQDLRILGPPQDGRSRKTFLVLICDLVGKDN